MCDSLQICLVAAHCTNILKPYGVKLLLPPKAANSYGIYK